MNLAQRRLTMNVNYGYCLLVLMFHSMKLSNRTNNIHECTLRTVFRDYESTFQQLLKSK